MMDNDLTVLGAVAVVLALLVLLLAYLNRRAVAFREHEVFFAPGVGAGVPAAAGPAGTLPSAAWTESETPAAPPAEEAPFLPSLVSDDEFQRLFPDRPAEEPQQMPAVAPTETDAVSPAAPAASVPPMVILASSPGNGHVPARPLTMGVAVHAGGNGNAVLGLVEDLLLGHGDLTPADLRRLDLYRPDRILDAVAELERGLSGRGNDGKRARLGRIRRLAEDMQEQTEENAEHTQPVEAPAGPPADEALTAGAAPGPPADEALTAGAAPEPTEEATVEAAEPPFAVAPASDDLFSMPADEHGTAAPPEPVPLVWDDWGTSEAEMQPVEPLVEEDAVEYEDYETAATPAGEGVEGDEYETGAPASEAGDLDLSSLDIRIRTAEDVLALPTPEQEDALSFLAPEELARACGLASDRPFKKAAIDHLEQQASPEALGALESCLDDGDPQTQLYALDAAERMLARR